MTRAYNESVFSDKISSDRTWRIREISDLKSVSGRPGEKPKSVFLRSLVTVCYAHWEGHVRFAANEYLKYVARRKYQYRELNSQFYRNYFMPRLSALSNSKSSLSDRCDLINAILNSSCNRFSIHNEKIVNAKANLNFEVLSDICIVCDIPVDNFESRKKFINDSLLRRRNSIAHGEHTLIDVSEVDDVSQNTISLMREFGTAVENQVTLKLYLRTNDEVQTQFQ